MLRKILVLPAGPDPNQPAMLRAASCAERITELAVLDIAYEPMLEGYMGNTAIYEPLRARVLAEWRERAVALAKSLEAKGFEASGKAVWDHPREEAVAKFVRSEQVDLVVTAPLAGAGGALAQSDWWLVWRCPVPVLIVKSTGEKSYRRIVAAVDPFHAHAKPAELDEAILKNAAELQAHTGATLTVLHCFPPPGYVGAESGAPGASGVEQQRREALGDLLRKCGIPPPTARLVPGAPDEVLGKMVERGDADVIVMGALARGRIQDWLVGSTAERVLHRLPVDVLAVNPAH